MVEDPEIEQVETKNNFSFHDISVYFCFSYINNQLRDWG